MKNTHLLRLKVGIILNFLVLGCMVAYFSLFPLLMSWMSTYLHSGESIFFPHLISRIDFLPLTLGQFLDQSLIFSLLWFVTSSIFPLVRRIRQFLKEYPEAVIYSKETVPVTTFRPWILGDFRRWDDYGIAIPKHCQKYANYENRQFGCQEVFGDQNEVYQLIRIKSEMRNILVLLSYIPRLSWNSFWSVPSAIELSRLLWALSWNYCPNFGQSHQDLFPREISRFLFRHNQYFLKLMTVTSAMEKSRVGGEGGEDYHEERRAIAVE